VITGDGAVVKAGDNVTVQYQGVNWTGGKVFDESWGRGPTSFTTDGVIAGFGAAMVGQTVGSRVVVIIPPDQGYGPQGGNSGAGIAKDDTLVFVIDILAAQTAG
jgi:peptidylprolyl isomerase